MVCFFNFGLPFEAARPLRAISERRSGLNAFARASAAIRALSERRSGVNGFRFAIASAIFSALRAIWERRSWRSSSSFLATSRRCCRSSSIAYRRWLKEKGVIYGTNVQAA
jgi:hypothetical protein